MNTVIQILGPTGVGKSQVALAVAREFNAEIISADSVQVYSGFDIGTDKISPQFRREIPHHLIDIIEDCSQFNASKFLDLSFAAAQEIIARGRVPLVCGGTALYHRVMIRGIFPESKKQTQRQQLQSEAASLGWDALRRQLEKIDPLYAKKIGPNDKVRLVRALEIYRNSGLPPSEAFRLTSSPFAAHCFIRIGLQVDRDLLYQNICKRVDRMLANGLIDEVKRLLESHPPSCPPFRSLGYKEILSYLRGETDLATARELIQCHSRQFAKRQLSWFRQEKDIEWFAAEDKAAIMEFIKKCLSKEP
ncbi:MAG: tRNA (adenosine(37)-N6)-dimethylallyltransferase MiaA [Chrysiogenales bacterium]|nr:MAG: tRNA (adenosine(37)-N6)-dimethylallyltransferase MiaA [Chrysiogenales bacterium]